MGPRTDSRVPFLPLPDHNHSRLSKAMIFKLVNKLPEKCHVAVSGGCDSMAGLHWLMQVPRRVASVLHVNHGTGEFADEAEQLVYEYCQSNNIPYQLHQITSSPNTGESKEAFWREQRYEFFSQFSYLPIVTCHTLDDCVEQYIIGSLVTFSKRRMIPYYGPANTIRPFRTLDKGSIRTYCIVNNIPYRDDPTNFGTDFLRAKIRNMIVPELLKVNPGLYNQVKKMILEDEDANKDRTI